MPTGKAFDGKPYAGNPHERFDEGEGVSVAMPRRGSLLYRVERICTLVSIMVAFGALTASAATYYVKPDGDDDNDGKSWAKALATPSKGFSKVNSDKGSTLIISNGVYKLTGAIGCTGGSDEASRTIVKGFSGNPDDVVLDAQGASECLRLAAYITISGITVSNGVNTTTGTKCPAAGIRFANNSGSGADYEIIVTNCVVTCCTNIFPSNQHGAAVDLIGHNLLVDSVIRNNTSVSANGAGVIMVNRTDVKGPPKMLRCRIEGNRSAKSGAGVYISANNNAESGKSGGKSIIEVEDCEIVGNTSESAGAGVYSPGYFDIRLTGCTIANNTVADANGGGVRFEKGPVTMLNCMVAGNSAVSGAGVDVVPTASSPAAAIATLICSNTTFRGNTAYSSGGGVRIYQYGRAFFDGCRFEGNSTTYDTANDQTGGGGVWLSHQGSGTIPYGYCSASNCVFAGNISGTRAGGLGGTWNTNFCGAVVNCVFTNNQSRFQGGGLSIREAKANPTPAIIRNCLFAFNETTYDGSTADSNGGGVLLVTKSNLVMENCTIVSNNIRNTSTANYKSGGIHQRWGGTLKNCIVAFNTRCGQPEDTAYWNTDGSNLTAANYQNCCGYPAVSKFSAANGCVAADPKFVDPANGDFTLQPGSPCKNAGANDAWMADATDLLGNPRIAGDTVDIGCYEFEIFSGLRVILR